MDEIDLEEKPVVMELFSDKPDIAKRVKPLSIIGSLDASARIDERPGEEEEDDDM